MSEFTAVNWDNYDIVDPSVKLDQMGENQQIQYTDYYQSNSPRGIVGVGTRVSSFTMGTGNQEWANCRFVNHDENGRNVIYRLNFGIEELGLDFPTFGTITFEINGVDVASFRFWNISSYRLLQSYITSSSYVEGANTFSVDIQLDTPSPIVNTISGHIWVEDMGSEGQGF